MEKKLCPLMEGYPPRIAICYVPQEIRSLIPDCAREGECLIAKLIPESFAAFSRYHYDGKKFSRGEIKKIKNHLISLISQPTSREIGAGRLQLAPISA